MERIVLRHLKGSKASQIEEFPLDQSKELVLGRDPSSQVRYDPERDDLVGRQHAKLAQDPNDRFRWTVTDLNSRNGTYLNKVRVSGTMPLNPGDVIQLGAGGPEVQFDLEPLPAHLQKTTRLAGSDAAASLMATRVAGGAQPTVEGAPDRPAGAVGKATVERLITETRSQGRRNMLVGAAAVLVVVTALGAWYKTRQDATIQSGLSAVSAQSQEAAATAAAAATRSAALTPAEIAKKNAGAVVQIEFSWKLIYTPTGGQVYHRYIKNVFRDRSGVERPVIDNGRQSIPAYVSVSDGAIEPALTLDATNGASIGVSSGGSGFVVSSSGFILTNRHVAANWRAPYYFDARDDIGALLNNRGEILLGDDGNPIVVRPPNAWIPSETKQAGPKGTVGQFQGRVEYLYVAFPKNTTWFEAQVTRVSDRHDAALIKVETPTSLPQVKLNDNYGKIAVGDQVVVMGYPAVSENVYQVVKSKDMFNRDMQARTVPDPTLSVGNIGKIIRAADGAVNDAYMQYSGSGDSYQLTINSTGGGNSGGPMFDSNGDVIGIFFATKRMDAQISFAVPIRYGIELMSVAPNAR